MSDLHAHGTGLYSFYIGNQCVRVCFLHNFLHVSGSFLGQEVTCVGCKPSGGHW